MERTISDRSILDKFTEEFCKIVNKHTKYIICSGFVAIAHGRSRGTEDIDMIIGKMTYVEFFALHNDLINNNFICLQSENPRIIFENYLLDSSARYIRKNEFVPEMEIKFAKDKIDNDQLLSRRKIPFTGLNVYFPRIEEAIAFKEEYLKSEKDIEDARHLRLIHQNKLDESYIDEFKKLINKIKNER